MKLSHYLLCGAATLSVATVPAHAATINLIDLGGVTGSQAQQGFQFAANYWASILTNNVTINLGVKFAPLAPNIIGSTSSRAEDISTANWINLVNATKSNSQLDQTVVLPTLTAGGASFIANGVDSTGIINDTNVQVFVNGNTVSSDVLFMNSAVIKAVGGGLTPPSGAGDLSGRDGDVTFSSNFGFDFNPTDGISVGTFDFIAVAIHEIGHALGFVSGVDIFDIVSKPNGPFAGQVGYDLNSTSIFNALDMFRYSNDPNNLAPGNGPTLDLAVGGTKYFSIDGGATALFGNTMSTGQFNGDGRQASHWKDTPACQTGNGIMDPTFCFGQMGEITSLDLAAFDAMGWNLSVDALANNGGYRRTTAQIYLAAIPEPATWAMMIFGFGLIGSSMRRRSMKVSFAV